MSDHTYIIKPSKDDKILEYVLNGDNQERVNNDEKARKMSQKNTEYNILPESITNRRMFNNIRNRSEHMTNNKKIAFSSLVE
jgi:hypothetical protein